MLTSREKAAATVLLAVAAALIGRGLLPSSWLDAWTIVVIAVAMVGVISIYERVTLRPALMGQRFVRGVRRGELSLFYQPIVSLETGRAIAAEALIRWQHPRRGAIAPADFVPLVERSRCARRLDAFVLEAAATQARALRAAGMPCSIAVNLPPGVFQDLELPDRIAALRERFDLEPTDLQIEITEQVLDEGERPVTVAAQLASRGVAVALDDFGAGYSALQRLVRLPLHTLKIDRSIVMQMTDNPRASVVVESAVELARALGLQLTIAEGVETPELLQRLRGLGVDAAQGYVISRPLPADEFTAWLRANAAARPVARPAVARPRRGPSAARS